MENSDLLGVLRSNPTKLTDQELMYLDYAVHSAWKDKCAGGSGIPFKPCSLDLLTEFHLIIRRQMENRGIQHLVADKLDARTTILNQERRAVEVGFTAEPKAVACRTRENSMFDAASSLAAESTCFFGEPKV